MSRVTVLLPLVPEIDTIGIVRSESRIHEGGVVPGLGDAGGPAGQHPFLAAGQARGGRR